MRHVLVLLLVVGCYNTRATRLNLAGNYDGITCQERCRLSAGANRDAVLSCVASCPGATSSDSSCGDNDVPPLVLCEDERTLSTGKSIAVGVGVAVALVLLNQLASNAVNGGE